MPPWIQTDLCYTSLKSMKLVIVPPRAQYPLTLPNSLTGTVYIDIYNVIIYLLNACLLILCIVSEHCMQASYPVTGPLRWVLLLLASLRVVRLFCCLFPFFVLAPLLSMVPGLCGLWLNLPVRVPSLCSLISNTITHF